MPPIRHRLDGDRWHLQHGPIDIVVGADGDAPAVQAAHDAAWQRFQTVLDELVAELPRLRAAVDGDGANPLRGAVARRMWDACRPFAAGFITPMAAVAGAVAQELIAAYRGAGVRRAWVNNGGDIALHLAPGEALRVGVFADIARRFGARAAALDGRFDVHAALPVRGIATTGWRGRSFSLGIADSVTVLAASAAMADAAATVIANAVDIDDARVIRAPAASLKDDSDLGDRLVTVEVPALPPALARRALAAGAQRARELRRRGLIHDALLTCQGQAASVDTGAPEPALA